MKRLLPSVQLMHMLIFVCLFAHNIIQSHGFSDTTRMQKCDGTWHASISSVCWAVVQKKNPCIASYDMRTLTPVIHKKVVKAGKSVTKCFIRLAFDATCTDNFSDDIVCTPTQEFYHADTHEWVPARKLHVGDKLLGRNGPEAITHIQYVKQSRTVYAIEVEDTHTFFVGRRSILTHNMFLPGEFATLAISLPASMVTAAGIGIAWDLLVL